MAVNRTFLLKALLQYNYFPLQRRNREEIPPPLNSTSLTPQIAKLIDALDCRKGGYDQIKYKLTRYNNIPRILSIPHPIPYIKLSYEIFNNWNNLNYILNTNNSVIIPRSHSDGRIIIMDYEKSRKRIERHTKLSFKHKFYVYTDIANFYPSIYSHSITWALVGFTKAKKKRGKRNLWFNKIDTYQRCIKRNETNGIPIGPATSNIVSELILAKIDKALRRNRFEFVRFIDDYAAYVDTHKKAEKFIRRLSEELAKYKLVLNPQKTKISQIPFPSSTEWIIDLTTRMPNSKTISYTSMIRFLDYALIKQENNPDGSILKYAIKSIINLINNNLNLIDPLIQYLLDVCIKYPVIIPLLDNLFNKHLKLKPYSAFPYTANLLEILNEHTINKRSDAMSWILYYLNKFSQRIPNKSATDIISSGESIPILFLYLSKQYNKKVINFYNKIISKKDLFLIDQHWLLLYQLFFDGNIANPYNGSDAKAFDILSQNKVSFIK